MLFLGGCQGGKYLTKLGRQLRNREWLWAKNRGRGKGAKKTKLKGKLFASFISIKTEYKNLQVIPACAAFYD